MNELQNWISHHEITHLRVPTSYCSTHARPHASSYGSDTLLVRL